MKDYLLLHYFALGTFSTKGVHIIKYLLTQIPCCILICVTLNDIFTAVQTAYFILYYAVLYSCYDLFHILVQKASMECKYILFYSILFK